jgi:excisionase family DNA binding protein
VTHGPGFSVSDFPEAVADQYLSVAQLSKLSGISEVTLRRRIKDGSIPAIQPGGPRTRLVVRRDVLDLLTNLQSAAAHVENGAMGETPEASGHGPRGNLSGPRPKWLTNS